MKNWAVLSVLSALFIFNSGMGMLGNQEELGTLIEVGKSEASIEKELVADEEAFGEVSAALIHKTLMAGAKREEVTKRFGIPVTKSEDSEGEEWMYRSRRGVRLEKPWIVLKFGKDGQLRDWDCSRVQCR